tara:strand:+ start:961 stop:1215 length:255 start_codon:yes stop_codon:yes gene_type:complete
MTRKLCLLNIPPKSFSSSQANLLDICIIHKRQSSPKDSKINLKINNRLSVKSGVDLGQEIPPNGWVYGWVNQNLGESQKSGRLV